MPDVPLQFTWAVAESGHRWVDSHAFDAPKVRARFLTTGRPIGSGVVRVRRYQPLSSRSGLFRDFSAVEPTPEAIKEFAHRYGLLGGNLVKQIPLDHESRKKQARLGTGEQLGAWTKEILTMGHAVDLWEAARQGDVERLGGQIHWEPDGSGVRIDTHPGVEFSELPKAPFHMDRGWIASKHLDQDVLSRFIPGDLVKPALYRVQSVINEHLHGRASPRLLWDEERERLGLYIVPDGLIGALWLQFARAVERNTTFRQCFECGSWFELAPGTGRSDKLYCSTPCRIRAYRRRQAEAARLHAEGRTVEEIARTLESEPETVRGWIERQAGASRSGQNDTT